MDKPLEVVIVGGGTAGWVTAGAGASVVGAATTFLEAGRSVEDAYQIRIDETTTSPSDIALGVMNVWVFFAPLFPAEFIHLHVQHSFQRPSA